MSYWSFFNLFKGFVATGNLKYPWVLHQVGKSNGLLPVFCHSAGLDDTPGSCCGAAPGCVVCVAVKVPLTTSAAWSPLPCRNEFQQTVPYTSFSRVSYTGCVINNPCIVLRF